MVACEARLAEGVSNCLDNKSPSRAIVFEYMDSKTMKFWFKKSWLELCTFVAYLILLCVEVAFHEPWADEAQAWQMAKTIPLRDLLVHYLRYEGSPGLWHTYLACLARLGASYTAMHWVTAAVAACGIAMLLFLSPFPKWIKLLLPFTFFLSFQYAVVARSYCLVPLLLFSIAFAWKRSTTLTAVLLGLLGNLALHALAISGGLALFFLFDQARKVDRVQVIRFVVITGLFYLCAVATVLPKPHDLSFLPYPKAFALVSPLEKVALYLLRCLYNSTIGLSPSFLIGLPILIGFCGYFISKHLAYALLPVATFGLFSGYYTNFWHAGLIMPTAICICWITWERLQPAQPVNAFSIACMVCIIIQIMWAVHAFRYDHRYLYSGDKAAADYLAPYVSAHKPMAITYFAPSPVNAFHSIGLAPYFDRPIFINQQRQFWLWSKDEHSDAAFQAALDRNPILIDALYDRYLRQTSEDPLNSPLAHLLESKNYHFTKMFCGVLPEGFHENEKICHVFFERK
jgi:hypothetical protein